MLAASGARECGLVPPAVPNRRRATPSVVCCLVVPRIAKASRVVGSAGVVGRPSVT